MGPARSYLPQGRRPEDLFEHGPQTCPHGRRHHRPPSASGPPRPRERNATDPSRTSAPVATERPEPFEQPTFVGRQHTVAVRVDDP